MEVPEIPATAPLQHTSARDFALYLCGREDVVKVVAAACSADASGPEVKSSRVPGMSERQPEGEAEEANLNDDGFVTTAMGPEEAPSAPADLGDAVRMPEGGPTTTIPEVQNKTAGSHAKQGTKGPRGPKNQKGQKGQRGQKGQKGQKGKSKNEDDAGLEACKRGDLAEVRRLVETEAWDPLRTVDRFGSPGMHWAASGGHLELCDYLLSVGADPAQKDTKSGRCGLHWAARQGHLEVTKWFVERQGIGVDEETKDGTTPLQLAAWGGFVDICDWLFQRGAKLSHLNKWGCHAAHFAGLAGELATCQWLQAHGLDLATPNDQGHNTLHKAAYGGHRAVCDWLQDKTGLDPLSEIADVRGQTPIVLAKKAGHLDLARWLSGRQLPFDLKKEEPFVEELTADRQRN